jgi:hypothetical protein
LSFFDLLPQVIILGHDLMHHFRVHGGLHLKKQNPTININSLFSYLVHLIDQAQKQTAHPNLSSASCSSLTHLSCSLIRNSTSAF